MRACLFIGKLQQKTQTLVGASGLDVYPIGITILRPLLIRTVEATNPEPLPRFSAVCNILLQFAESLTILSKKIAEKALPDLI